MKQLAKRLSERPASQNCPETGAKRKQSVTLNGCNNKRNRSPSFEWNVEGELMIPLPINLEKSVDLKKSTICQARLNFPTVSSRTGSSKLGKCTLVLTCSVQFISIPFDFT